MAAMQTCLIASRWRTLIVSAIARGASGAGRTTPETAVGRGPGGIEYLGIWLLSLYSFILVWISMCFLRASYSRLLGARLLTVNPHDCGKDPHGDSVSDCIYDRRTMWSSSVHSMIHG